MEEELERRIERLEKAQQECDQKLKKIEEFLNSAPWQPRRYGPSPIHGIEKLIKDIKEYGNE